MFLLEWTRNPIFPNIHLGPVLPVTSVLSGGPVGLQTPLTLLNPFFFVALNC